MKEEEKVKTYLVSYTSDSAGLEVEVKAKDEIEAREKAEDEMETTFESGNRKTLCDVFNWVIDRVEEQKY